MMSDKRQRNTKTFIVVTNQSAYSYHSTSKQVSVHPNSIKQRLRVGARDEKHARQLVKEYVGNGTSINAIWEVPKGQKQLPRGIIVDDMPYLLSMIRTQHV